jgi:hypothetical protein
MIKEGGVIAATSIIAKFGKRALGLDCNGGKYGNVP